MVNSESIGDQARSFFFCLRSLKSNHDSISWLLSERDNEQANNKVKFSLRYHENFLSLMINIR